MRFALSGTHAGRIAWGWRSLAIVPSAMTVQSLATAGELIRKKKLLEREQQQSRLKYEPDRRASADKALKNC